MLSVNISSHLEKLSYKRSNFYSDAPATKKVITLVTLKTKLFQKFFGVIVPRQTSVRVCKFKSQMEFRSKIAK